MEYLHWDEKKLTAAELADPKIIDAHYAEGYVFTRIGRGVIHKTRSVRIDLKKFELSSENRRILKKIDSIAINRKDLPLAEYHWSLGKLVKDFYDTKFGPGIFSALKAKEIFTELSKSNFNMVLEYSDIGYVVCYENDTLLHYSYPFYDLTKAPKDMGLGMMTKAILYAKEKGLSYIYLGSLQRPTDTYKFQFKGIEWFDGKVWKEDAEEAKKILTGAQ